MSTYTAIAKRVRDGFGFHAMLCTVPPHCKVLRHFPVHTSQNFTTWSSPPGCRVRDKRACYLNATCNSILTALESIKMADWRAGLSISFALPKRLRILYYSCYMKVAGSLSSLFTQKVFAKKILTECTNLHRAVFNRVFNRQLLWILFGFYYSLSLAE